MKCRFPGCNNEPTRWSRRAFCGEHRGAARSYSHSVTNRVPVSTPPLSDKLRRFHMLKDSITNHFPDAGKPYAKNPAGYEVMVLAPGGLRA